MAEAEQIKSWVESARQGDELAVTKLLGTYHPILRARVESRLDATLRARYEPEDVLQQTYIQVLKEIGRFENRGPNSFINWVFTILDHKLIDVRRAANRQARAVSKETPLVSTGLSGSYLNLLDYVYADSETPSRVVRRDEALCALMDCVSSLSDSHRQVLQLRFLQGMSVTDVASSLDKSDGAVVALTKRALDALKKEMEHLGEFSRG